MDKKEKWLDEILSVSTVCEEIQPDRSLKCIEKPNPTKKENGAFSAFYEVSSGWNSRKISLYFRTYYWKYYFVGCRMYCWKTWT